MEIMQNNYIIKNIINVTTCTIDLCKNKVLVFEIYYNFFYKIKLFMINVKLNNEEYATTVNKIIPIIQEDFFSEFWLTNYHIRLFVLLSYHLFFFSIVGLLLNRKNLLKYLFFFEINLLSSSILFLIGCLINQDITGQIYTLFLLGIAASETAIGLAILILNYKLRNNIEILEKINEEERDKSLLK